eukprot:COSAG01_NODE_2460_length_7655_cov_15.411858_6_plen_47_part_00
MAHATQPALLCAQRAQTVAKAHLDMHPLSSTMFGFLQQLAREEDIG